MKLSHQVHIARNIINARIFKKRIPLIVSWSLTYRCNLKCLYCGYFLKKSKELDVQQIISLIDELLKLGNKCIIFSGGGEALLKEELGRIIDYCFNKGIYVVLNSNGVLVKKKINEISIIDEIQLSLDGPKSVHDFIRNQDGVYDKVIEAIKICKDKGIKIYINTVLSKYNLLSFIHVLEVAERFKIGVYFQPATQHLLGDERMNPLSPPIEDYRRTIDYLIKKKQEGSTVICNSIAGLKHLYNYPEPKDIFCLARLLLCCIEPDGRIFSCDRLPHYQNFLLSRDPDFKSAFENIYTPYCASCWCGAMVDFNLAGNFNLETITAMWDRIRAQ